MKFGGTSLGSAENIKDVSNIISSNLDKHPVVVVSAVGGVTDLLLESASQLENGKVDMDILREKHESIIRELDLDVNLIKELDELESLLQNNLGKQITLKVLDEIQSFGERLSSKIIAAYLQKQGVDAISFNAYDMGMQTDSTFGQAELLEGSYRDLHEHLSGFQGVAIVTGFLAKNEKGEITTLGRGGSDYTASIIGAALKAEEIQIWTDVNGVMSADPRIVENAHTIETLSFDEAAELAYFGAKVLHPKTIHPAIDHEIPVVVKNTMEPANIGTKILNNGGESKDIVKSISVKKNITVINIDSTKMLAAYGFLAKIFGLFDKHQIPVDMVATSEVSVSLTIDNEDHLEELLPELEEVAQVKVEKDMAIVIVVGEGMAKKIGKAAPIFDVLAENSVHIHMVSQGASEINIGLVVENVNAEKAVQVLHKHYFG
tara:strand:- start:105 stop:1403 length:1299 start_codon:yes stop_codon:yes gene_type:complete